MAAPFIVKFEEKFDPAMAVIVVETGGGSESDREGFSYSLDVVIVKLRPTHHLPPPPSCLRSSLISPIVSCRDSSTGTCGLATLHKLIIYLCCGVQLDI